MKQFLKKFWRIIKLNPLLAIGLIPILAAILFGVYGFLYFLFTDLAFRVIFGGGGVVIISWFCAVEFWARFKKDKE